VPPGTGGGAEPAPGGNLTAPLVCLSDLGTGSDHIFVYGECAPDLPTGKAIPDEAIAPGAAAYGTADTASNIP
jgi:hypothetical protein